MVEVQAQRPPCCAKHTHLLPMLLMVIRYRYFTYPCLVLKMAEQAKESANACFLIKWQAIFTSLLCFLHVSLGLTSHGICLRWIWSTFRQGCQKDRKHALPWPGEGVFNRPLRGLLLFAATPLVVLSLILLLPSVDVV